MQDDTRSDAELAAELAAIDASAHQDSPAALTASLCGRLDLLPLVAEHQAAVLARRAEVVALLANAALPRRIAAFDRLLEAERAVLAAAREELAALPWPDAVSDFTARCKTKHARRVLRPRIDGQLHRIGLLAADRAALVARQKDRPKPVQEASGKGFLAPWSGLSPAPLECDPQALKSALRAPQASLAPIDAT